jgi:molybdopterin-guanine dinucleotide biosynthesis protein A
MGQDKALLTWEGETLLTRSVRLLQTVSNTVRIIGSVSKFPDFSEVIEDIFPDCGPLGGIHAALVHSTTELNLVIAVDMPFITAPLLTYLLTRSTDSRAMITVPRTADGWQPLCAVYRKNLQPFAEQALKARDYKIDNLFSQVKVCEISTAELAERGFSDAHFHNLNTPQDLRTAERAGKP